LWAAPEHQEKLFPNVLSWDSDLPFPTRFRWTGTGDVSPLLSIPEAFAFMDRFGEPIVTGHNHQLVMEGMKLLSEAWKTPASTPESMIGAMVSLPMPEGLPFALNTNGCEEIQKVLWKEERIAVCVPFAGNGSHYVRIAAQIYNSPEDYEKLARAVLILKHG
jgi:isopenicillin-N epimerase